MNIQLTWDLFILVFFVVIVAYSLIIGRDNTLKVILGTYVAGLAADAFGNIFGASLAGSAFFGEMLTTTSMASEQEAIVFIKVLAFVTMVILFAVKGAFEVNSDENKPAVIRLFLSFIYASLSAGLIISVILVFMSGVSFIGGGSEQTTTTALWGLSNQSRLIGIILNNIYIWFAVPALAFIFHSFYAGKE
jgi:hypothetical protein